MVEQEHEFLAIPHPQFATKNKWCKYHTVRSIVIVDSVI